MINPYVATYWLVKDTDCATMVGTASHRRWVVLWFQARSDFARWVLSTVKGGRAESKVQAVAPRMNHGEWATLRGDLQGEP